LDAPWSVDIFRQTIDQINSNISGPTPSSRLELLQGKGPSSSSTHLQSIKVEQENLIVETKLSDGDSPRGGVIANHLVNSLSQSVLYLPNRIMALDFRYLAKFYRMDLDRLNYGFLYTIEDYIRHAPYWQWGWNGKISKLSLIPVGFSLLLIAVGTSSVWQKRRWLAFLPLLAFLVEIGIYALARRSGGRYLITVDWIVAMFYSIGLVQILVTLVKGKSSQIEDFPSVGTLDKKVNRSGRRSVYLGIALGCLMFGLTPVAAEGLKSNPYTDALLKKKMAYVMDGSSMIWNSEERELVTDLLENGGEAHFGRALYPSYYLPETVNYRTVEGEYKNSTSFYISGTIFDFVVLPGKGPEYFPQGANVLVVGCPDLRDRIEKEICLGCGNDGLDALVAVVYDQENGEVAEVLWRESSQDLLGCSKKQ
jgi:hypothetical protein